MRLAADEENSVPTRTACRARTVGAAASHLLAGHGPAKWIGQLVFAGVVLGSWALRPRDRRLADPPPRPRERPAAWLVPLGVVAAFLIFSLLTPP